MPGRKKKLRQSRGKNNQGSERVFKDWMAKSGGSVRFVLQSRLGAGGMCEVCSAIDLRRMECGDPHPVVAVKRLLPEMVGNRKAQLALAREFFTLRHLVHPGVVRVFDLHREHWGVCFSMELLEGASAHSALGEHPSGLGKSGITAGYKIFDILNYLHAHGVTHGDVKPANIVLEQDGRLVLLDFNVAQFNARPGLASAAMSRGLEKSLPVPAFSRLHSSPRMLSGAPPTPSCDVFSASCTVYELLTGEHPYKMMPADQAAKRKLEPARPAFLPGRHWKWLRRGLLFESRERPSSRQLMAAFREPGWFRAVP